ncbi:MAG: recombination regulator RecX [Pseudomonadota bacterium]|jgi:regulatory protein
MAELSLRGRAVQFLARREHSRAELQNKLAGHAESPEQLSQLLEALQQEGLLSDQRYAQQRSLGRAHRLGDRRLQQELRHKGVSDEDIQMALDETEDEAGRCRQVWLKKFGTPPASREERAKQLRFLQYRGFSSASIRAVLQASDEDDCHDSEA